METNLRPRMVDDPGIWFGIASGLVVVALLAAGAAGLGTLPTAVFALVVAGVAATRLPRYAALGLGVVTWAFFTGFDVNAYGQLTFGSADLVRLAAFVAATALGALALRGLARTEARHG